MRFTRLRSLALLPLLLAMAACSEGGDASTPTGPSSSGGSVPVTISFGGGTTDVRFSAQLEGRTYTAVGQYTISLSPGTYVVSGTYRGMSFGVNFFKFQPGGGVESGSVRSLAGVDATPRQCGVFYTNIDAPNSDRPFRLQFTVTSNSNSACQF